MACSVRQAAPGDKCERAPCCPDTAAHSSATSSSGRTADFVPARPDCQSLCLGHCHYPVRNLTCTTNDDCPEQEYCRFPTRCGADGRCEARPTSCATASDTDGLRPREPPGPDWLPGFCGCDGKTYATECDAAAAGSSVAHEGECQDPDCLDISCYVYSDCCYCGAYDQYAGEPEQCDMDCSTNVCTRGGLLMPMAYCAKGRCLLTDRTPCDSDADCHVVDDCCSCMALPISIPGPVCPVGCKRTQCDMLGFDSPKPRCVAGTCRVSGS